MSYDIQLVDVEPCVSMFYKDIDDDYKISNLNTDYFDYEREVGKPACPRLKAVFSLLCNSFDLYYATREIGGNTQYDFFCMMQSCLDRNADTLERQLMVYDDDIANPILGRTEVVTYDTTDKRDATIGSSMTYGHKNTREEKGIEVAHHVDVPANSPNYDTDRTRDKMVYGKDGNTSDPRKTEDTESGTDTGSNTNDETRKMSGTVTTELSDLGVRPNYESLNGFLDSNRTFIQEFINVFEECFSPRYQRVIF